MTELARLFVKIIVSNAEANKKIDETVSKVQEAEGKIKENVNFKDVFNSLGGGFKQFGLTLGEFIQGQSQRLQNLGNGLINFGSKLERHITKPAIAAGTAISGTFLFKGWQRMTAIDNAKVKLEALGNSGEQTKEIMNNALHAVKGTAFGLDEAANIAASATASGVKAGAELQQYLSDVADLSAVAGTSMGDVGYIFNKVTATGRLTGETMSMLTDRGMPVLQWLANETGKTTEEVQKMISKGQISAETFQSAVHKAVQGAAKDLGSKTIQGNIQNMWAAVGRVGAAFLGSADDADSFAGKIVPILKKVIENIDKLGDTAKEWGKVAGEIFGGLFEYFTKGNVETSKLSGTAKTVINALKPIIDALKTMAKLWGTLGGTTKKALVIGAVAAGPTIKALGKITKGIGKTIEFWGKHGDKVKAVSRGIGTSLKTMGKITSSTFKNGFKLVGKFGGAMKKLPSAFSSGIKAIGRLAKAMQTMGIQGMLAKAKLIALTVAQKAVAAAQKILNVVMSMNPIGLIIAGITALIAILVVLWHKSDTFRNFVKTLWENLKNYAISFVEWIKPYIRQALEFLKGLWDAFGPTILALIEGVWNNIKNVVETVINVVKGIIQTVTSLIKGDWEGVWEGIKNIVSAVWDGIKGAIENVLNIISNLISTILNAISGVISDVWEGIKSTTETIWEGIKNAIWSPVEWVVDKVKWAIDKIKEFLSFEFKWPHIPLPHFHISGSLNPLDWFSGGLPKLSVEWYAKGAIMKKPTMFGFDPLTNTAHVGGEAGDEAIAPISTLQQYVRDAVSQGSNTKRLEDKMDEILQLLSELLPAMTNLKVEIDGDKVVGSIVGRMDKALGTRQKYAGRFGL